MTKHSRTLCLTLLFITILASRPLPAAAQHDRAFWQSIAKQHYAVPANESADMLAHELSALLASPDPELRDDLAYSILARWIYRPNILSAPTLISLTDEWRANIKTVPADAPADAVLKRSFSALCLSEMAKREAKSPFMGADRYHNLGAEAVAYLEAERDLRGYDAALHWIHATAHTADLLAALARSALLTHEEAANILQAIAARLSTAPQVYTQGEQDRLAAAVVAVLQRKDKDKDMDASSFETWLAQIQKEDSTVWTATTVESLARYQNHNYTLQALTVRLALEPDSPQLTNYRQQVLALLRDR